MFPAQTSQLVIVRDGQTKTNNVFVENDTAIWHMMTQRTVEVEEYCFYSIDGKQNTSRRILYSVQRLRETLVDGRWTGLLKINQTSGDV
jgi:hypothetical protein